MAKKLSDEKIQQIRKFCMTHPKGDAVRRFRLAGATIHRHTKDIDWKNPKKIYHDSESGVSESTS